MPRFYDVEHSANWLGERHAVIDAIVTHKWGKVSQRNTLVRKSLLERKTWPHRRSPSSLQHK